ncbi:MAG: tyrosine-protein phosphatase [Flavisolibacter sp.]
MFSFKKKHTAITDLAWLHADMHSHLIPGIDDGSPDISTSLQLIQGLVSLGYKKLITTPHILWDMYPNTIERISKGMEELKAAVRAAGIEVELKAAAEYFIDDHFQSELQAKAPLLTIGGNMVLVEFSLLTAPMDLQDVLFEMQLQNYQPVIGHPERYTYLARKKEFFDDLKASGCLFQVNLLSLSGHYGAIVQELAEYLLKKNYYDFAGTDLHHVRHLSLLQKLPSAQLKRLQETGLIKNHLL